MRLVWLFICLASGCLNQITNLTSESEAITSSFVHMQVVAHEDDDILFMNPDIQTSINLGYKVVTVFMTAGQASGAVNQNQVQCAAEFANQRQIAAKTAYAQMAAPNVTDPSTLLWTRELIVPDAGVAWPHTVERYTLQANPNIILVFLNLPDAGSAIGPCSYPDPSTISPPNIPYTDALITLADSPTSVVSTIVPDCGPQQGFLQAANTYCANDNQYYPNGFACISFEGCSPSVPLQNYSQQDIIDVLQSLLTAYQPILVRTLDPNPLVISPLIDYDNSDHVAAARFTDKVLANYHGPNNTARYSVEYFKGYPFYAYPQNLGFQDRGNKQTTAYQYARFDLNYTRYLTNYANWYGLLYNRYPANTQWMQRSSDGRLVAVTVQDRQLKLWYESTPGGSWIGPVAISAPGAPFSPTVSLYTRSDGRLVMVAQSEPLGRETWASIDPLTAGQDIRISVQDTGAIAFSTWTDIGAPWKSTGLRLQGKPSASSYINGHAATLAFDGVAASFWQPSSTTAATLLDDFGGTRYVTMISLNWSIAKGTSCAVQTSLDSSSWSTVGTLAGPYSGTSYYTTNDNARYARASCRLAAVSIAEMKVETFDTGQLNGVPTYAIDGSGRQFIFERNSDGYLWYSYTDTNVWQPWKIVDRLAQDISDEGISAITADDGNIEIVTQARSGQVLHYRQNSTAFTPIPINVSTTANAPTIAKNQDGRLEIFYREITDPNDSSKYGRVATSWQNSSGQWMGGASNTGGLLYGDAGRGPIAAIRRESSGQIMLFQRNSYNNGISATWQIAVNGGWNTQWAFLGGAITDFPAAASDAEGRAVVVVKSPDNHLFINRESSSTSIGSFTGWTQVGN